MTLETAQHNQRMFDVTHCIWPAFDNGYWFWGRPSVIDLWRDLRAVTSEIRPDWDLSTRGLREAWKAGDFSHFHGWNKQASMEDAAIARNK